MTKTQLKHLKDLDSFLKKRNMQLIGDNCTIIFDAHKYGQWNAEKPVYVELTIGTERGQSSDIRELEKSPPPTKHHYYIQKGKLKSYC